MTVKLKTPSNGSVSLTPQDTAADVVLTVPATTGVVNTSGVVNQVPAGSASAPSVYPTGDANTGLFFPAADTVAVATGGAERYRVDSSGNLLVGATSNSINGNFGSGVSSSNGSGGIGTFFVYNSAASGADSAPCLSVIKAMATTSSSARFVQFYANGTATAMGGIVGNGASNVQFASISDAREKTNIAPISGSLQKIIALNPVEFDWIVNGEHCPAGFVAQDVEQVFPEFVVENMAGENQDPRKGLTGGMTGGIIAHLVKAIQEQQAIINSLQDRITALENA